MFIYCFEQKFTYLYLSADNFVAVYCRIFGIDFVWLLEVKMLDLGGLQ